jgi:hypothetical protein
MVQAPEVDLVIFFWHKFIHSGLKGRSFHSIETIIVVINNKMV